MLHYKNEQCPFPWCSVLGVAISMFDQDRIRLDTFIKKANGTVRMERVMDRIHKISGR